MIVYELVKLFLSKNIALKSFLKLIKKTDFSQKNNLLQIKKSINSVELKRKLRHEDFREKTREKLNLFSDSDKVLFRACCLPDNAFNEIIKYCLY